MRRTLRKRRSRFIRSIRHLAGWLAIPFAAIAMILVSLDDADERERTDGPAWEPRKS